MKQSVFSLLVFVVLGFASTTEAQVVELRAPNALRLLTHARYTVRVVNATESTYMVDIGGQKSFVRPGGEFDWKTWQTTFDVGVFARKCDGADIVRAFGVPEWAQDASRFGKDIITDDFLSEDPKEGEVRRRVDVIKRELDRREVLGRKAMKRELEDWLKLARRHGPFAGVPACRPGATTQTERVAAWDTWGYQYGIHYDIFIREDDGSPRLSR